MTVVAHHVALDGLSFATIVSDLVAAYDARADGRSPIWPSPRSRLPRLFRLAQNHSR